MSITSPLKSISSKNLLTFFPNYKGTKLLSFPKLPIYFHVKTQPNTQDQYLTRQFLYSDFKQSFPHFALLSKSCAKLGYFPEIFNVYNKIVVKCYTEKDGKKIITTKDFFMAFLLNELAGNQSNVAYSRAIDEFPIQKD